MNVGRGKEEGEGEWRGGGRGTEEGEEEWCGGGKERGEGGGGAHMVSASGDDNLDSTCYVPYSRGIKWCVKRRWWTRKAWVGQDVECMCVCAQGG